MDSWKAGRPKNLAETSLWQARVARNKRTANLGNRHFTAKDHSNQSLMRNSYFDADDVRAMHYIFGNIGSWKAGRPTSNPSWLKTQSWQAFIASWLLLHGNMGPTFARCRNKWTTNPKNRSKIHCDRHELLGSREDSKSWVQESITYSQLKHRPLWCSCWIVTPNSIFHHYRLSDLFMGWMSLQNKRAGMDSWNKHVQQIFFPQCITFLWTWTAERLAAPKT